MVKKYHTIKKSNGSFQKQVTKAIEEAIEETRKMQNGGDRIRTVEIVYIDRNFGSYSYDVACDELYISKRYVSQYLSDFVVLVGEKLGMK